MFDSFENITHGSDHLHCLKLLRLIGEHLFLFFCAMVLASAGLYFGVMIYAHAPFSRGDLIVITICFSIIFMIFVPLFLFLLSCCEIIAEYLACLLFPRKKQ